MAHYFFNLRSDLDAEDPEGAELPDLQAAREKAEHYALDLAAASILEQRKVNIHHRIEVADPAGEILLTVEFGDVIRIEE